MRVPLSLSSQLSRALKGAMLLAGFVAVSECAHATVLPDDTSGTEDPPASFGKLDKPWVGCPKIPGVYAWPPIEGGLGGRPVPGRRGPPVYQITSGGLVLSSPFYVAFEPPNDKRRVLVKIALVPAQSPEPVTSSAIPWKRHTYANSEYSCSRGWLIIGGNDVTEADSWYGGGKMATQLRVAPLASGDLAVGRSVRLSEQSGHLFSWGDQHAGRVPLGDRVYWRWARLRRVTEAPSR